MRVVFASARSSPGVTTAALACASVWPSRVLLVEAGEDGGSLAAWFGLPLEPGLTTLAAAVRHDAAAGLAPHVHPLPGCGGRIVALVGPPAIEPAQVVWRSAGRQIGQLLSDEADGVVLVDAGRLTTHPLAAPLIADADRLLLVARPRVDELQTLAQRLASLSRLGPAPELLLIGERPYGPTEVASTLGCRVAGVLAHDPDAADALAGARVPRRLSRSPLLRTVGSVVDELARDGAAVTDPGPPIPRVAKLQRNGAVLFVGRE